MVIAVRPYGWGTANSSHHCDGTRTAKPIGSEFFIVTTTGRIEQISKVDSFHANLTIVIVNDR